MMMIQLRWTFSLMTETPLTGARSLIDKAEIEAETFSLMAGTPLTGARSLTAKAEIEVETWRSSWVV